MGASAFSRCFAGPAENNGVFGRSRNMMIAVSIAVSQVDSSRTPVKIFCPFRNSYPHHRASSVLSYGISDLAIRLKWMLSAYALAGRNWPPPMLVLFADIRRYPGSRESRPRRSRRDNIGSGRSLGGARGREHPASWSVAAAFDRKGKAIGCEPPARDERTCPPGGGAGFRSVRV